MSKVNKKAILKLLGSKEAIRKIILNAPCEARYYKHELNNDNEMGIYLSHFWVGKDSPHTTFSIEALTEVSKSYNQ